MRICGRIILTMTIVGTALEVGFGPCAAGNDLPGKVIHSGIPIVTAKNTRIF